MLVYVAALVVGAVMIAASSVLTLRAGALSAWLGPVGALISLVVLVGAFILPSAVVYLLLFWVLCASVSLIALSTDASKHHQGA